MYFLLLELFGLGEMPHLKKYKCTSNDVHAYVLEVWYRAFSTNLGQYFANNIGQ